MRAVFAGVFILCCSCGNRAEAGPIGSFPFENSGMQLGNLQHLQVGETIADWLKDVKDGIFETPSVIPDIATFIDTTRESYERQKKFLDELMVDMSNVEFDPEKDWGLRVGHWYLIRQTSDDAVSSFWRLVRSRAPAESTTDDGWLEYDFPIDQTNIPPLFNNIIPTVPTTTDEIIAPFTENSGSPDNETVDSPNDSK